MITESEHDVCLHSEHDQSCSQLSLEVIYTS